MDPLKVSTINKDKSTCIICRHSSSIQAHPPVDTVHYISTLQLKNTVNM